MSEKFSGEFVPVIIYQTQHGAYTNQVLANFMALRDGDSDPTSGGYPVEPSERRNGVYRRSDGRVFEIREITIGDARAKDLLDDDLGRLTAIKLELES